jgi:hypothetical protein
MIRDTSCNKKKTPLQGKINFDKVLISVYPHGKLDVNTTPMANIASQCSHVLMFAQSKISAYGTNVCSIYIETLTRRFNLIIYLFNYLLFY